MHGGQCTSEHVRETMDDGISELLGVAERVSQNTHEREQQENHTSNNSDWAADREQQDGTTHA
jgi:hypothetical protein